MAARTPSTNPPARAALAAGALGVLAIPLTVAVAQFTARLEIRDAWFAIPIALVLGVAALVLARAAHERLRRTIGRVGGERAARAGHILGRLAIALALSGAIAVAFYELLVRVAE